MTFILALGTTWVDVGFASLIVGCYLLIILHMRDTSRNLSRIYEIVNAHLQRHEIHQSSYEFVRQDVCDQVRKAYEENSRKLEGKMDKNTVILEEMRDRLNVIEK